MYQVTEFKEWFMRRGYKHSTYNTHNSIIQRIDHLIGGLDEKITSEGIDGVIAWAKQETKGPFETYPSHARSALNRYIEFTLEAQTPSEQHEDETELDDQTASVVFHLEREMQAAVRKQLNLLEEGLKEADGGKELSIATGKIDILAEDKNGAFVVIELKAGACPSGALEQVLGYAEALAEEKGKHVRAYLVAAEFSDRIRAAAKRARDLELRTYEFCLSFHSPT